MHHIRLYMYIVYLLGEPPYNLCKNTKNDIETYCKGKNANIVLQKFGSYLINLLLNLYIWDLTIIETNS